MRRVMVDYRVMIMVLYYYYTQYNNYISISI